MSRRIVVVGDALLDRDVVGTVTRVCPDAPVPVLDVTDEVVRPGGAALAAALLAGDGHDVVLVAALGAEPTGDRLRNELAAHGVDLVALATSGSTREKVRVRCGGQSLVRVDRGAGCAPVGPLPERAADAVRCADAVLVSDYAGGVTADPSVRELVAAATHRTAVVWDPHPRGSAPVAGVRLATPNRQEAADLSAPPAAPDPGPSSPLAQVQRQADDLVRRWAAHAVSVTLGAGGALLSYGSGSPLVVPAAGVPARDTCGAGDRYAATATAVLASGGLVSEAVQAAVRDATRFVAAGGAGTVPARPAAAPPAEAVPARGWDRVEQVRATGGTVVATGGCFDLLHAGHVELLRAARGLGDALVVLLNSDASVRRLKGPDRPLVPHEDRARVLEALACVDAVMVFGEDRPDAALRRLRPQVWVKGGDYALTDLPEAAALREWGGQAVVLPYLDGRSTSGLIGAARAAAAEGRR